MSRLGIVDIEYALVMSIVFLYYVLQSFALTCVALYYYVLVQLYVYSVCDNSWPEFGTLLLCVVAVNNVGYCW